uniref:V-set and transmembrane domain containing 4a n=1 Tax=Xiphophorus couchianus TaxID=32473 RepID=A0A3B5LVA2_9TELE
LVAERDNLTLSCLVSEKKWSNSVLILRWFYLIGIKKIQQYGNYSRHFPQPKFHLFDDEGGKVYRLLIINITGTDQGFYSCRVQEIRKYKNTWRASSNGSSTTQLTVHFTPEDGSSEGLWVLFADVYLCAVLICSMGLLSIFLFSLVLTCQYFHRRHRLKASYLFVKCPESSSGETVTSSSSCSNSPPRTRRKETRQQVDRGPKLTPSEEPLFQPPIRGIRLFSHEDSLTYAELELVRPRQEPPVSPSPDATPSSSETVYAQILFQEEKL